MKNILGLIVMILGANLLKLSLKLLSEQQRRELIKSLKPFFENS